jgi:hypothetical protein
VNRTLFDLDDPEDEYEITAPERAFLAALEARTAHLSYPAVRGMAFRTDDWDSLVACLVLRDPEGGAELLDFGVHFYGDRVRGDRLHNQFHFLPERPSRLGMEATGTPEELAARTAEWFSAVLNRPLVLFVWLHEGRAYAIRYLFADTGETLSQFYIDDLAPPGRTEQLTAAGHVQGRGWVKTSGLPAPSLYFPISGDLSAAAFLPSDVPAGTERGSYPGLRYE